MVGPPSYRWLAVLAVAAACTESSDPNLAGPPYFRATIAGVPWEPPIPHAYCGDSALVLSGLLGGAIPDVDLLEIQVANVRGKGSYPLADTTDQSFAWTRTVRTPGPTYHTLAGDGGRVNITGITFTDSAVTGSFQFRLVSQGSPSYAVAGSFRLLLEAIYTVTNPDGGACHDAT